MAYGGSLLPMDSPGDGRKRGLLFIAANARLDLQFEVIQADWLNKGEILGQAGLGRCPMTGANLGGPGDSFLESGAVAPVTRSAFASPGRRLFLCPRRQGHRAIAHGRSSRDPVSYEGYSMGDTTTPTLLSEERIKGYAGQIFAGAKDVVRIGMPSPVPGDPGAAPVAFVARVAHVKQALSMRTDASNQMITSVADYQEATRTISTGHDMIVSTQPDGVTGAKRGLMIKILEAGWAVLSTPQESVYVRLARTTKRNIEATLRRTASPGPSTSSTTWDPSRPTTSSATCSAHPVRTG